VPGLVGAAWLVGSLSWFLWACVLPSNLTLLAKSIQTCVCVGGIAFAVSVVWPVRGQNKLKPDDIGDFWAFVRGAPPEQEHLRGIYRKFRRSLGVLVLTAIFMAAWAVVVAGGLAQRR
jgi:hypothetical protein